jgi:hypothetical protein
VLTTRSLVLLGFDHRPPQTGWRDQRDARHDSDVYFSLGGIISCVVGLVDGGAIETGMIGKDGQFGAGPALDHKVSPNHVVMQVEGDASVIESGRFRQLTLDHPPLGELVVCYEQFFLGQVQQTAACNAHPQRAYEDLQMASEDKGPCWRRFAADAGVPGTDDGRAAH